MFNSDTLAGMLLSILIRLAANPHHSHVEKLGLELALFVVQILLVFVFPAHPVHRHVSNEDVMQHLEKAY